MTKDKHSPAPDATPLSWSPEAGPGNWFKAIRNPEALELIHANLNAFVLLYVIAYRAQWRDGFNRHDLKPGQALVGDWKKCGMSEKQYRTAKKDLQKWHFAAFKGTNKGTIATLMDERLFSIRGDTRGEQNGNQRASEGRARGEQGATTKTIKKDKKDKTGAPSQLDLERQLALVREAAAELKNSHCAELGLTNHWDSEESRRRYLELNKQAKAIRAQIIA